MNPGEVEVLVALMKSVNPRRVVEIGVNEGLTAKAALDNIESITEYIGIDVLPGYVPACAAQRREVPRHPGHLAKPDPRFRLWLTDKGSLDVLPTTFETIDHLPCVDAFFIDGDHGAAAVGYDTWLAHQVVRKGGIIIWHDYINGRGVDVQPVLEHFATQGHKLQYVENTWLAFERVGG